MCNFKGNSMTICLPCDLVCSHCDSNESTEMYLRRIGAKNNPEKKEEFSRFDRED